MSWSSRASALALLASACSACSARAGQAEARLQNGQPCLGLSASETRAGDKVLDALEVHDASTTPKTPVWSLAKSDPMSGVHLSQARCLWFGETPSGYGGSPPAALLREGVVYELVVKATRAGESRSLPHAARFCLAEPTGGGSGFGRIVPRPADATSCSDP